MDHLRNEPLKSALCCNTADKLHAKSLLPLILQELIVFCWLHEVHVNVNKLFLHIVFFVFAAKYKKMKIYFIPFNI